MNWLKRLGEYGVTEQDFAITKVQLSKKFGQEPSEQDVFWSLFQQLITKKRNDLQTLKVIYYNMALYLNDLGKDFFQVLQLSAKMELMNYKQNYKQAGIKKFRFLHVGLGHVCNANYYMIRYLQLKKHWKKCPFQFKHAQRLWVKVKKAFVSVPICHRLSYEIVV